jgi:hypothetical protein
MIPTGPKKAASFIFIDFPVLLLVNFMLFATQPFPSRLFVPMKTISADCFSSRGQTDDVVVIAF